MKYDVEEYTKGSCKIIYAITADGEQIGLNLPESCESVEMGREFLGEGWYCSWVGTTPETLSLAFAEFLEQRKEAELPEPSELLSKPDEQQPEPEESTESEYVALWFIAPKAPHNKLWQIIHIESSNLVPLTFDTREDAEGFLKWRIEKDMMPPLYCAGLRLVESEFARYKSETAEPKYRCPYCKGKVVFGECGDASSVFLRCDKSGCEAYSPVFNCGSQPDESWIAKEPA